MPFTICIRISLSSKYFYIMKKILLQFLLSVVTLLDVIAQTDSSSPYCTANFDGGIGGALTKYISKIEINEAGWISATGTANPLPGFTYYNNLDPVPLTTNNNYTIKITHSGLAMHFVAVFIDYNQDDDFADAGEVVNFVTVNTPDFEFPGSPTTLEFTVPASAVPGKTRMRVLVFEDDDYTWNLNNNTPPSCTDYSMVNELDYGETEDYDVMISNTPVSTVELNNISGVKMFPNPASDILNIVSNSNAIIYAEIVNTNGAVIKQFYPQNVSFEFSVKQFEKGLYIIRVYTDALHHTDNIITVM